MTFSERDSLKSTPIKINHIWTDQLYYSLLSISEKAKVCMCQKGDKCNEIRGHFSKSQKLLTENLHEMPPIDSNIHSISMAGYVTTILAFFCGELQAHEVSNFCDFDKWPLSISLSCPFQLEQTYVCLFFRYMCLIRSSMPNLCPNLYDSFWCFGF